MEPAQNDNVNGSPAMETDGDMPRVSETPDADRSENGLHGDRPPVTVTVQGQAVSLDNVIADNVPALLREALIALGATQERTKQLEREAATQREINARLQASIDQLTQRRRDQGQQQASGSLTVQMPKLKDFKSEMDPEMWLNRIELFFDDETSSAQRLRIAVAHLDDPIAAMWRHLHPKDEVPAPTWETLRKWLVGTFGTREFDAELMTQLQRLTQAPNRAHEYCRRFQEILGRMRAPPPVDQQVELFRNGLRTEINLACRRNPQSPDGLWKDLESLIEDVRECDQALRVATQRRGLQHGGESIRSEQRDSGHRGSDLHKGKSGGGPYKGGGHGKRRADEPQRVDKGKRPMSKRQEKEDRKAKGLCLQCGDPNHFIRDCPKLPKKKDGDNPPPLSDGPGKGRPR